MTALTTQDTTKTTTIRARISQERKILIEHAANLRGVSLSDFLLESAYEKAVSTIESHQLLELSQEDTALFMEVLANPPEPNKALKEAAELHKQLVK